MSILGGLTVRLPLCCVIMKSPAFIIDGTLVSYLIDPCSFLTGLPKLLQIMYHCSIESRCSATIFNIFVSLDGTLTSTISLKFLISWVIFCWPTIKPTNRVCGSFMVTSTHCRSEKGLETKAEQHKES